MRARLVRGLALIALLSAGCASAPDWTVSPPDSAGKSPAQVTQDVRLDYDRGFDQVAALLPENSQDPGHATLGQVIKFRKWGAVWAELASDDLRTIEEGYWNASLIVVVPPGHEALDHMVATLQVDVLPEVILLAIKPERVSERWAGLFMIHELSHLMDRAVGTEPRNPTREQFLQGELRAYEIEVTAANLVSNSALGKQIDHWLEKWRPSTHEELLERARSMGASVMASLETSMGSTRPLSEAELSMRFGFYVMAFLLRHAAARGDPPEALYAIMESLLPASLGNK